MSRDSHPPDFRVTDSSRNVHRLVIVPLALLMLCMEMVKRILIVDDEPDFSELVQYRLGEQHFDFKTTTNSTDALNSAWDRPPDLILLDLLLPDLDGLSVCEIFARHPATQHIPVIMITAVGSDVTRFSAEIAGARHFFAKPVDFEKLKAAIYSLLQIAESTPTAQPT